MEKIEKYKPFLLFTSAIVIALITSVITYNWLKKETISKRTAYRTEPVAIAAIDLSWGTVLKKDMMKLSSFLAGSLPSGSFFSDTSSLEGRVLITPVKANEPILKSRLSPEGITAGGVAAVIDKSKRAMAVKVDKVIGVSGFIHPGNRVDVLVTLDMQRGSNPVTKIVLQNINVLAAGTELEQKGKDQKPIAVDVITLELTPEEAEKLALAATEGKIQLALRSFNNTDSVKTEGATISALMKGFQGEIKPGSSSTGSKKSVNTVKPPEKKFEVEVFKGSTKTTETFVMQTQL